MTRPNPTLKPSLKAALRMVCMVAVLLFSGQGWGQQAPTSQTAFSLDQAVAYALSHNITVKNAETDRLSSVGKVGEIRASGLPQINGSLGYTYNAIVQRSVLETGKGAAAFFGTPNPATTGLPTGLGFALPHALSMGLTLNQLLFSPSYILGLRAASVYTSLASKQAQKARQDVKAQVTKAYYQAMVGQVQATVLDYNLARLDSSLRDLRATFKAGYVEQIDVYRLEVQRNNLMADKETITRSIELAFANLKFAMGYSIQQPLTITDKLETATVDLNAAQEAYGAYNERIEVNILNTQEELAKLDLKNKRAGYLPTLTGLATLGANSSATRFVDMLPPYASINGNAGSGASGKYGAVYDNTGSALYRGGYRWYSSSIVGVTLSVPVWDSFSKRYQIQQSKLSLKKVRDSRELLQNSIDFDIARANIAVKNAASRLQTQQRNLDLAKEVVRVTRVKYKQGVGSSLEVTNAETDLRVAQTNYYAALYDALVAKVDADVATGRLTAN